MELVFVIPVLLLAVILHEVAHAWQARREGDPTAERLGRITLNPIPHIDLFGSILIPALLVVSHTGFIFGWAKPVPVNPANYRDPRWGDVRVSLAGIVTNLGQAVAFTLLRGILAAGRGTTGRSGTRRCGSVQLRHPHQPHPGLLQPDPDPAPGRLPRPLPPAAPEVGAALPGVRALRAHRHHGAALPGAGRLLDAPVPGRARHARRHLVHAPVDLSTRSPLLPREADFFTVDLDRFQGPLDLLLHLIRQQDIDVFDIPISKITEQFLKAIRGIGADQLDHAGEFLEMAATLVRIKAQMLLPRHEDDEDQDPRAELVRRLLEYEQIREISHRLSSAEAERARRFAKGYVPPRPRPEPVDTPLETTWEEVFEAALGVTLPEAVDRRHRVTTRPVAMEDKVTLILETLADVARVEFSRLLRGFESRMHGVMTLLAGLELTRRRTLVLRQVSPFSELWLYRRDEEEDGADAGAGGDGAGPDQAPDDPLEKEPR